MILTQRLTHGRDIALWAWYVQVADGPVPPPDFCDDGCTAAPDYLLLTGEAIWPACRSHDYHYSGQHGDPTVTRALADDWLEANAYRCIRYQQRDNERGWRIVLRPLNGARALLYARAYAAAVRRLGARHYTPTGRYA
jgi:hypothetical protein